MANVTAAAAGAAVLLPGHASGERRAGVKRVEVDRRGLQGVLGGRGIRKESAHLGPNDVARDHPSLLDGLPQRVA